MNEKQRTQILGGVTVLVLGVALVSKVAKKSGVDEPVVPTTRAERGAVAVVGSGSPTQTLGELSRYYRPITDADPFSVKNFNKPRRERGNGGGHDPGVSAPSSTSPSTLTLRLTGVVASDDGMQALLEDRTQGKGVFVKKGDKLGDRQVADIRTSSLVLGPIPGGVAAVHTSTFEFNDKLEILEASVEKLLHQFTIATATSSAITHTKDLPAIEPEKAKSILEELRAKRRKSLGVNK